MSIELDEETQRLIDQQIQSGRFADAESIVSAAVRHFVLAFGELDCTRDQLDKMIAEATASLESGEGVDGEEFFAELEEELKRQKG